MSPVNVASNELCGCGRPKARTHCPKCGSMQLRALASKRDYVTRDNGQTVILMVYRCRTCGLLFNDDDCQLRCTAPAREYGRAKPRASSRSTVSMEETQALIDKYGKDIYVHLLCVREGGMSVKDFERMHGQMDAMQTQWVNG